MKSDDILKQPICQLDVSVQFKEISEKMGYKTLEEIIVFTPEMLSQKKDFSYTWLIELSIYLEKQQLLHLLQPISG